MSEVQLKIWRVEPHAPSQYLLILLDENQQMLPMTIGICEAMAIHGKLRRDPTLENVGLSHDLLGELIIQLGGQLKKVVIDDLWNKHYFAKLHIALNGETILVDARPSDAIAVALRLEAPLFAADAVMVAANEPDAEEPGGASEF